MLSTVLQWIGDETLLQQFLTGLSTTTLLIVISVCIALLSMGADWMIDGVVDLAQRTGLPKIVIGATVVSLGTTLPEAFVSVIAAYTGNPGLALGNGVGSIIADTGLIFGLTCVLVAVPVNRYILNRTGWVQLGSATLLVVIAIVFLLNTAPESEPTLNRWVGFFFLVLLTIYLYVTYRWAKQGDDLAQEEAEQAQEALMGLGLCWLLVIGGLLLVVIGARVLVPSASEIAYRFAVPEDVIAATLVALGTSLPELMTAIAAVRKGHPEITVGNIVGADVLNVLFVIGAAAAAAPLAIPPNFYYFHFPAMLIILYMFRFFITMNKTVFHRWQGFWLLGVYGVYVSLQYALNIGAAH
ncbi:MAG: calcium/sodium antiporter [Pseudomonadota bacterium]|nr:calcium/sodium antiporter [Pseudomonadota bacterium]